MNFMIKSNKKYTYKGEQLFTIPNIISMYRLFSFPLVFLFAILGYETLFVGLFIFNLFSDVVDGFIARRFNLQTKIGSRIDSLADIGSYILAFIGIICFKMQEFEPYLITFIVFFSVFLTMQLFSFLKFRKFPSLHLYSTKIGGYIQGSFFLVLFTLGIFDWLFYLMIIQGILAFTESIIIQVQIPEMQSDVKGLFWVLKNRRRNLLR